MHQSNLDRILGILCSVLDAYSAVLFLPTPGLSGGESTYYVASAFSLGDKIDFNVDIHPGRGLVGWILRNQEPLLVSNVDQRQNYLGYYTDNEESSIKAFMGYALPDGGGALCVDSKRQYSFAEKDQKMLHLFADLIAQMRSDEQDFEEKRVILQYYGALRTIYNLRKQYPRWAEFLRHFLDHMATITGFTYSALYTRDSDGQSYSIEGENTPLMQKAGTPGPSYPINSGLVGWVFRHNNKVRIDGLDGASETRLVGGKDGNQAHFPAVLAMPLVIQRQTRGVVCLANDRPFIINDATEEFMRMVTDHLALFLENLYVKCRLRDMISHPATPAPGVEG